MRLTPEKLQEITKVQRPLSQAKWFAKHFGVNLPTDTAGPIITEAAFAGLVAKHCGLTVSEFQANPRPAVKLRRKKGDTAREDT